MRKWLDPWPSVADLFSALLVAVFAGFILVSSFHQQIVREVRTGVMRVHTEADRLLDNVRKALLKELKESEVRPCGTDVCIDIPIQFEVDRDEILPAYRDQLRNACESVRNSIAPTQRDEIEIFIEGHSDAQQPLSIPDARSRYLFNWNLSSRRAASVLYEFVQCGIEPVDYRIISIGYADSQPLCSERTPNCFARNRRTTFRLRPDTRRIEERLSSTK